MSHCPECHGTGSLEGNAVQSDGRHCGFCDGTGQVTEPTPKPTDALEELVRVIDEIAANFERQSNWIPDLMACLAAWEKERADFNYANEAANKGVAEREMVQSELAALRAAVERIEGEMRKQCDQRYEDARFEDAASTTDLVCWADDLRSAREGGKP